MPFTLAIAGRPNVGKSTLFNRLTGRRVAITDDTPGVTRDWREGEGNIGPLEFSIIDTAGWEHAGKGTLQARMTGQSIMAIERADAVLFVIDGREGVTSTDQDIARALRKTGKPIALVANKAESNLKGEILAQAIRLGFGEPTAISAEHNLGMADLYDAVEALGLEEKAVEASEDDDAVRPDKPINIAFIGRPNAGKSTLMNQLLKEERVLTGPEAGITRDAISADFSYKGRPMRLVDTAGIRRRSKVEDKLEKMAVGDTLHTIQHAEIVVLLMDATLALEKQDLALADMVEKEGRGLVVAINKWDLVEKKNREKYLEAFTKRMGEALAQVKDVPVVTMAAETGENIHKVIDAVLRVHALWNRKLGTGELNRWLHEALEKHAPPMVSGRRIKIRYLTQTKTRPPTFQLFCNLGAKDVPESYMRYLTNDLRREFDLPSVPIRMILRKGSNPYADKKN